MPYFKLDPLRLQAQMGCRPDSSKEIRPFLEMRLVKQLNFFSDGILPEEINMTKIVLIFPNLMKLQI
jgi:hypothetical protein